MKFHKEVLAVSAAILMSGPVIAQSGSADADAEANAQNEQGSASGQASGEGSANRNGVTGAASGAANGELTRSRSTELAPNRESIAEARDRAGNPVDSNTAGSADGTATSSADSVQGAATGGISTQTLVEDPQTAFSQMDTNADGVLQRTETTRSSAVNADFAFADQDGNEVLSRSEFDNLIGEFEDEMAE